GLKTPGAEELTAAFRNGPRKVVFEGATYLRPTIIWAESMEHPLFSREFLCPYACVVECPQAEMIGRIGTTLAVTAITRDEVWLRELMAAPNIERLNIGPVPTLKVSWDQPHEGNLFEFLWKRRALERGW
ncbi:MAG: aldehyde dehydrogenase, partial [Verrucomicrobia bacterium]